MLTAEQVIRSHHKVTAATGHAVGKEESTDRNYIQSGPSRDQLPPHS